MDELAQQLVAISPSAVCSTATLSRQRLDDAKAEWQRVRAEMISTQEEREWEVYDLYAILGDQADALVGSEVTKLPLRLGERALEIALASKVAAGETETQWFARRGSTPITELPADWPDDYRALVQRRLDFIASDPYLQLIERP